MAVMKQILPSLLLLMAIGPPQATLAATGIFGESRLPTTSAGASGIVAGPDGSSWWFTEFSANWHALVAC
jgi:hypothetical protein